MLSNRKKVRGQVSAQNTLSHNNMSPLSFILVSYCIYTVSCQDLLILVGDMSPAIHQVSLQNARRTTVDIPIISRPIAIDFDAGRNDLYWTDVKLKQIWTRNLLTSENRLIRTFNDNSTLDGIAVDASLGKIFYTDAGNDVIGTINTDGTDHNEILDSGHDQPRAIVLHEKRRQIYWTDWGDRPYIASASYEGSDITEIVTTGLIWPNGLALDKQNDVLYWCDAKIEKIEAVRVDGTGRRVVISEPNTHYFDIFYHEEALYYTDWTRRGILTIPARGGEVGPVGSDSFSKLTGIHVTSTMDVSDCQMGQYGAGCDECGHCKLNSVCDKTTGYCFAGCTPGYTGGQCTQECPYGKYGLGCAGTCGADCTRGCHFITGVCHPPKADKTSTPSPSPPSKNNESLNSNHVILIGAVAGGVIVLLVIAVVIVVVVVILLRRKREVPKPCTDYATLEANRPPNPYSVASELPPAYASIGDWREPWADNSGYASLQPVPAPCGGATGYLSFNDESNGKKFAVS